MRPFTGHARRVVQHELAGCLDEAAVATYDLADKVMELTGRLTESDAALRAAVEVLDGLISAWDAGVRGARTVTFEVFVADKTYDASTGAFKRGWGGHGMPLSEVSNAPIPGYKWTGGPPPEERNFVPDLHFVEISKDRKVYIGERGQNRIQVFTTGGKWLQDIMVSPNSPAQRGNCGGLGITNAPAMPVAMTFYQSICGTTYKMVLSKDPQQKYLFVADAHNDVIWTIDRQSGKTLGSFGGSGRLAGQMTFPNSIGIDTRGNVYVGEVDMGKRIQKFVPVN